MIQGTSRWRWRQQHFEVEWGMVALQVSGMFDYWLGYLMAILFCCCILYRIENIAKIITSARESHYDNCRSHGGRKDRNR
jgi:hypothetical protein